MGGVGGSGGGLFPVGGVVMSDAEPAQDGPTARARHIASTAARQSWGMDRVLVPAMSWGEMPARCSTGDVDDGRAGTRLSIPVAQPVGEITQSGAIPQLPRNRDRSTTIGTSCTRI